MGTDAVNLDKFQFFTEPRRLHGNRRFYRLELTIITVANQINEIGKVTETALFEWTIGRLNAPFTRILFVAISVYFSITYLQLL